MEMTKIGKCRNTWTMIATKAEALINRLTSLLTKHTLKNGKP
ncbi:MAG: hypothetical protein AOA65_1398 [Candidatus Bathyarchaeota archaeon BA1]|nr:MAG: hypothetical protein AOA65_1398 [Candidatus Bathyarchaeota archaeon BA1]